MAIEQFFKNLLICPIYFKLKYKLNRYKKYNPTNKVIKKLFKNRFVLKKGKTPIKNGDE